MQRVFLTVVLWLAAATAFAQTPYAGMHSRAIKALSEQQVADLAAGRGMGFALAGELNGYPGPSHVIELADKLELSAEQQARMRSLFDAMKAEALPLGAKLIAQETELDKLFAGRSVTEASLNASTAAIAVTQGELRQVHLKYHLFTADALSANQIKRYAELRGYTGGDTGRRRHHH